MKGKHLVNYLAVATDTWEDGSVRGIYLLCRFENIKRKYKLHFKVKTDVEQCREEKSDFIPEILLEDEKGFKLCCNVKTGMPEFYTADGKLLAKWSSRISYDDRSYCFHFFVMEGEPGIYLLSKIKYPYTEERELAASQAFNLGRCFDRNWEEAVPMELTLALDDSDVIEKRNFMEDISSYPLSDFWEAFWQNRNIDSFNHQLTGGVLAVHDEKRGLVLAHARQVCGSMAHCPMRLKSIGEKSIVSMNPFGTYDGRQRYYPTQGNGSVAELYEAVMPQAGSLAPAYNGASELCIQRISDYFCEEKRNDVQAFADGCVVYAVNGSIKRFRDDNVILHQPKTIDVDGKKLLLLSAIMGKKSSFVRSVIRFLQNVTRFT